MSTASEKNLIEVLLGLHGNEDFGFPITRSTVKAVILVTAELMMKPKVMRKLQDKVRAAFREINLRTSGSCIKYLGLVIKETFKLYPTATILISQESTEACEINGYVMPTKTSVIIKSWAIMWDP